MMNDWDYPNELIFQAFQQPKIWKFDYLNRIGAFTPDTEFLFIGYLMDRAQLRQQPITKYCNEFLALSEFVGEDNLRRHISDRSAFLHTCMSVQNRRDLLSTLKRTPQQQNELRSIVASIRARIESK